MAKRKKRTGRLRGAAPAVESVTLAATPACQLRPVAGTPDFEGATGATINLFTHDHVGTVMIAKAEYGGGQLVAERAGGQQDQFQGQGRY